MSLNSRNGLGNVENMLSDESSRQEPSFLGDACKFDESGVRDSPGRMVSNLLLVDSCESSLIQSER